MSKLAFKVRAFLAELKGRRVHRVAVVYAAAAFVVWQAAEIAVPALRLPDRVLTFTVVASVLGFPVAVVLAWIFDITPSGLQRTGSGVWESLPGAGVTRVVAAAVMVLAAIGISAAITWRVIMPPAELDRTRVVVYPLAVTPAGFEGLGEDLATWIGHTLESRGRLRWIDGWYVISELQRAGVESLSLNTTKASTESLGAGLYIRGRVSLHEDSAQVVLELLDVAGDSIVSRAMESATRDAGWERTLSERATRLLLAEFQPADEEPGVEEQDHALAASQFMEAERAYRRAKFEKALDHYQGAVRSDSTFAAAALKGSLAALWSVDHAEANQLVELALRRAAYLPPHRAHFAHGIQHYLAGRADSASSRFKQVLTIAPESWEAWARLGEVYTHLLPSESPLDSLAEAAFSKVHGSDPGIKHVLYHLIEHALRKDEIQRAEDFLEEFRSVEPNSALLAEVDLAVDCVAGSPDAIDWPSHVRRHPQAVYSAATALSVGGHQTDCARAGWTAIVLHDTASGQMRINRHFSAMLALQSLLVAEARHEELAELLDADTLLGHYIRQDFYVLDALAGAPTTQQAAETVEAYREQCRSGTCASINMWLLGSWEAHTGRAEEVRTAADSLATRAARTGDRVDHLLAQSLMARAALAGGDTATALEALSSLVPTKPIGQAWYPWETLAYEQMALAELMYTRQRYTQALRIAANLDAPARRPVDLMYLPASLSLRMRAARALGDNRLAERCATRPAALGREDILRSIRY